MGKKGLQIALKQGNIEWHRHALERMIERGISRRDVKEVLRRGEIIEEYPNNKPYPSALFLGWINDEPLHVVIAFESFNKRCFIVTVYRPDLKHFELDYKTRRLK